MSEACCWWMVTPDPNLPSGQIEMVNCAGDIISVRGVESLINADFSCVLGPVEPSTWGRIKAVYGSE